VTAGTVYGRISASAFASVTTVTVVLDSGALDSGLSAVSYGLISPTNTSAPLMDDSLPRIMNASDKTKLIREDASAIATGTTRVRSMPNYDVRLGNITPGIGPISYSGRTIPTGWLDSNQAPVSRVTYAGLFEVVVPLIGTFTVTIASPGVFTLNSHGFAAGEPVYLTTTGALPTGLSANVIYYIASAGLTTNTFQLSSVPGGASINTSGSQSGTHSIRFCPYGLGDGSTTFGLPKTAGRYMLGDGSGSFVENVTNASINTGTDAVTVQSNTDAWITGMPITWTVSGTPPTTSPANLLDNNDTVYIVRIDSTTVKFATTLANAQNGTVIDITAAGSGTFTMTYALTPRLMGYSGGEEQHLQYITEMPSHQHDTNIDNPGGSPVTSAAGSATPGSNILTAAAGGSVPMNIRTPYTVTKMIISY
jgi:microcystin-dependent protein